jgi:hypothetical protein
MARANNQKGRFSKEKRPSNPVLNDFDQSFTADLRY